MAGENLLLKWNDHHNLFFPGAEELCHNEEYTDVTLSAGSALFPAHRLVLSVCSPYFRQLFRRLGGGSTKSVIYLKDVEPRHLEMLLEYMYKGEIRVEEQELVAVLNTAQGLDILGLTDKDNQSQSEPKTDRDDNHSKSTRAPPPSSAYEDHIRNYNSAVKKQKLNPTPLFNVTSSASLPLSDNSIPALPQLPALPATSECPDVKEEVTNFKDEWNNSTSQQDIEAYNANMSEEMFPENNLTEYSNQVYTEGTFYQGDEAGHSQEKSDPDFLINVQKRRGRGRPRKMSYTCHICGKHLRDKYNLDRHISSHYGEKNFSCDYCTPLKLFADQSNLRNHMKSKHPEVLVGEKDFSCYQCVPTKLFTDQPSLTKHVRSRHHQQFSGFCIDATVSI